MASNDDVGPPEVSDDVQRAILCTEYAKLTLFVLNSILPARLHILNLPDSHSDLTEPQTI